MKDVPALNDRNCKYNSRGWIYNSHQLILISHEYLRGFALYCWIPKEEAPLRPGSIIFLQSKLETESKAYFIGYGSDKSFWGLKSMPTSIPCIINYLYILEPKKSPWSRQQIDRINVTESIKKSPLQIIWNI